jgi:hypothetical protein
VSLRLEKMFRAQRGECHFCGRKCRLPTGSGQRGDDLATVDHVFDRHHHLRDVDGMKIQTSADAPLIQYQLHVMACQRCNVSHVGRVGTPPPGQENRKVFQPAPPLKA